jgi:hypothetical protein
MELKMKCSNHAPSTAAAKDGSGKVYAMGDAGTAHTSMGLL